MAYTCKTCGAIAEEPGHLCDPCGEEQGCSFCGAPNVSLKHVCKGKLSAMEYCCENCGRVATEAKYLCKPRSISGGEM